MKKEEVIFKEKKIDELKKLLEWKENKINELNVREHEIGLVIDELRDEGKAYVQKIVALTEKLKKKKTRKQGMKVHYELMVEENKKVLGEKEGLLKEISE